MALANVRDYLQLVPMVRESPSGYLWSSYDAEADVLYVSFRKAARATDSELTKDDVIVRYDGEHVVGFTVLHASKRTPRKARPARDKAVGRTRGAS